MAARPHISPALQQLRGWVTIAACVVILAALCQVTAYAIVRNTDVRATHLEGSPNDTVVDPDRRTDTPGRKSLSITPSSPPPAAPAFTTPGSAAVAASSAPGSVDANRIRSTTDANLEVACAFTSAVGLIASSVLCVCSLLGIVVAGGGNVPGIAYTVRAGVWSIVILGMALPWSGFAGPTLIPGVFAGYGTLVAAAEGRTGAAVFTSFVIMPVVLVALSGCCLFWFRRGVEAGIILTSLSEVDEALEREMGAIRERGVGRINPGGRASAGLHQVMEPARVAVDEQQPRRLRMAAGAERIHEDPEDLTPSMFRRRGDPGTARPI